MIGKLQELKKKNAKSYLTVQRFLFQGIFGLYSEKKTSVKFAPDKPALCGHRSVNLFVYVYDICLHKT